MQVKSFLRGVRKEHIEINAKIRARDSLYSLVTGSAIRYDIDRVQTSPQGDKMDKILSKVADVDAMLEPRIDNASEMIAQAIEMIDSLSLPEYRAILTDYYINCYKWENVAELNSYSIQHTKKIHGDALNELRIRYETK